MNSDGGKPVILRQKLLKFIILTSLVRRKDTIEQTYRQRWVCGHMAHRIMHFTSANLLKSNKYPFSLEHLTLQLSRFHYFIQCENFRKTRLGFCEFSAIDMKLQQFISQEVPQNKHSSVIHHHENGIR